MERDIENLWERYEGLLRRLSDHNINKLLSDNDQRIVETTYHTSNKEKYCGPGGLLEFSLDLANAARNLNNALELNCSTKSIILVSLLGEISKIGDLQNDLYIVQESEWHREKLGQLYTWNEDCPKMSLSHRTLFILQHYGIRLEQEEWLAIQLMSGMHLEENKFYLGHNKGLPFLIQTARQHILNS